ncbi:hypothetical protein [Flavobacterium sp. XGLA_31]|uniref:hypothetical protein n=1 Tax=Flavobacterium sp. XGLA_31 TaxID=3447666 RepID=UPI003F3D2F77
MKKIVFGVMATVSFVLHTMGQKNNSYNAVGVDFVKALRILQNDYDNGKIKEINQTTTDYYLGILPIKATVNEEVVGNTVNALKTSNVKDMVMNSKLTDFSKEILLQSQTNAPDIEALVDKVNHQKLSASESEVVLTSLAITYNLNQTESFSKCHIDGQTGPNACQAAGALLGLLVGEALCGPLCAVGGAIIGAAWGSSKD